MSAIGHPSGFSQGYQALHARGSSRQRGRALFDPGWLFVIAGLGLLCAVVLISAQKDLESAQFVRDQTLAVEKHRQERLARYHEFLSAVERREPALIESLAGSQLNRIPARRGTIPGTVGVLTEDASLFPALEPPPLKLPAKLERTSTLSKLVGNDTTRLLLLAGSAVLLLIGLLPPART